MATGTVGRRNVTSESIFSVWTELLNQKLKERNVRLAKNITGNGFVCRKCFRSLETLKKSKEKVLGLMEVAIRFMPTTDQCAEDHPANTQDVTKPSVSSTSRSRQSLGKHARQLETEASDIQAGTSKRPCHSPKVEVCTLYMGS